MKSFRLQIAILSVAYFGLLTVACCGAITAGTAAGDDVERGRLRAENSRLLVEVKQWIDDDKKFQAETGRIIRSNKALEARVKALENEKTQVIPRPFGWTPPVSGSPGP